MMATSPAHALETQRKAARAAKREAVRIRGVIVDLLPYQPVGRYVSPSAHRRERPRSPGRQPDRAKSVPTFRTAKAEIGRPWHLPCLILNGKTAPEFP